MIFISLIHTVIHYFIESCWRILLMSSLIRIRSASWASL